MKSLLRVVTCFFIFISFRLQASFFNNDSIVFVALLADGGNFVADLGTLDEFKGKNTPVSVPHNVKFGADSWTVTGITSEDSIYGSGIVTPSYPWINSKIDNDLELQTEIVNIQQWFQSLKVLSSGLQSFYIGDNAPEQYTTDMQYAIQDYSMIQTNGLFGSLGGIFFSQGGNGSPPVVINSVSSLGYNMYGREGIFSGCAIYPNSCTVQVNNEVPLPAGIYLFLSGLVGLGLMRGRNA